MELCNIEYCTGCGACFNVCSTRAIEMVDKGKFGKSCPVISATKCIKCGACVKSCPILMPVYRNSVITTYAACRKNDDKHYASSSGGIAATLYEYYLSLGYWVAGVSMTEGNQPSYILTKNICEINNFRKSKYLEAATNNIYSLMKKKLADGEKIFFVGLSCQCAAVKKVCSKYEDQLVIADLICHGTPQANIFSEYLKGIENKYHHIVQHVSFRNEYGECLVLSDDRGVFYNRHFNEDPYMMAFMNGDILAEACFNCQYTTSDRVGDLTLGDFWGHGELKKIPHSKKHISVVLINTKKGKDAIESIADLIYYEERTEEEAVAGNSQLRAPSMRGENFTKMVQAYRENKIYEELMHCYGSKANKNYYQRMGKEFIKKLLNTLGLKKNNNYK